MSNSGPRAQARTICSLIVGGCRRRVGRPAFAQSSEEDPFEDTLFGDWGGVRSSLNDRGIEVKADYLSESSYGLDGGLPGSGGDYAHEIGVQAVLDLDKLVGWSGGKFTARIINREGADYGTAQEGTTIQVQQIAGLDRDFRLVQFHLEQTFFDEKLSLLVGRSNMTNEFGASRLNCYYISLATCGQPFAAITNGNYQVYPAQTWAARVKYKPSDKWALRVGAFERNDENGFRSGFEFKSEDALGWAYPVELERIVEGDKPGSYRLGYIFDDTNVEDLAFDEEDQFFSVSGNPAARFDSQEQAYLMVDQTVWAADEDTSASLFGLATLASKRSGPIRASYTFGGTLEGVVPGRPDDRISALGTYLDFSEGARDEDRSENFLSGTDIPLRDNETHFELNYSAKISPGLRLTPGLQYVIRPGGRGDINDALFGAVRVAADF